MTDVSVAGMPSSSGSQSARRCHLFALLNLELKAVKRSGPALRALEF